MVNKLCICWSEKLWQQLHIYKYVHSYIIIIIIIAIIIINQHVAVTPVTITRVSHKKNTFNIQIIVENCMIEPLGVTFGFL
jgi:hypothetical protein